ncbi:uncharacterized protein [Notamacropus eugenii]|uniref:uncharacterized protein n=1 Tax=Notamacropus eugenii TaxID=9315 RepID=UPI003B672F22
MDPKGRREAQKARTPELHLGQPTPVVPENPGSAFSPQPPVKAGNFHLGIPRPQLGSAGCGRGAEQSGAGEGAPEAARLGLPLLPPEGFHLHIRLQLRSEPGPQSVPRVPPRPPPFGRVGPWEGASLLLPPPPSGAQPRPRPRPQPPLLPPPLRWSRLSGPPKPRPRLPGYLLRADCPTRAEGLTPWTAGGESAGPLQVKWFGIKERSPGTPRSSGLRQQQQQGCGWGAAGCPEQEREAWGLGAHARG